MTSPFMQSIRDHTRQAIASGDLKPIESEQITLEDQGMPFIVRWIAALGAKDAAGNAQAASTVLPGGPRDPAFNPFLNPDPALLIGPVGEHHVAILNKFPVCLHHLVLARREFADQLTPLELEDFQALAIVMSGEGGLGFYNGGAAGGASQRHKHVQWIPASPDNATLRHLVAGLPAEDSPGAVLRHPALAFRHGFVRVQAGLETDQGKSARSMLAGFIDLQDFLGLHPGNDGLMPACNLLVNEGWMMMVPRVREHFEGASFNALSFGGTLYVRNPSQMEAIRAAGPLSALASVSQPIH